MKPPPVPLIKRAIRNAKLSNVAHKPDLMLKLALAFLRGARESVEDRAKRNAMDQ